MRVTKDEKRIASLRKTKNENTDTDEKELAYSPATLPSDNGSADTTETSCGDLD